MITQVAMVPEAMGSRGFIPNQADAMGSRGWFIGPIPSEHPEMMIESLQIKFESPPGRLDYYVWGRRAE